MGREKAEANKAKGQTLMEITEEGRTAIRPTQERLAKGGIIQTEQRRGEQAKPWYAAEGTISAYLANGIISKRQAMAGFEFQAVYYVAHGSEIKATSYEPRIVGNSDSTSDRQQAAINKLNLYRTAHGEELFACLVAIAGLGQTHSAWAQGMNWHPTCGKPIMVIALNKHAQHLKLPGD